MNLHTKLLAVITVAVTLLSPARAMGIRQFEQMEDADQYEYIGDLVWAAIKILQDDGKPELAAQVHKLFLHDLGSKDFSSTDGTLSLGMELVRASAFDAERAAEDPKARRLHVEDAMRATLKEKGITLPDRFMAAGSAFKPKLPLKGKRGNDDTGFGTPSEAEAFLTLEFLQAALEERKLSEIEARSRPLGDCEDAAADCNTNCGLLPIYDRDREAYLKQSDFKKRCARSCSAGFEACKVQDSLNGCDTYLYRCVGNCPWTVIDTYVDLTVRHSDSFKQCSKACTSASAVCKTASATLPPRKRTAPFNSCEEAQGLLHGLYVGRAR